MTIDAIADAITDRLASSTQGRGQVEKMDVLVTRLNDQRLRVARASLRARPGITFSVNTTQAWSARPTLAVRAHGVALRRPALDRTHDHEVLPCSAARRLALELTAELT